MCDEKFINPSLLESHVNNDHSDVFKSDEQCPVCDKSGFKSHTELTNHIESHYENKRIKNLQILSQIREKEEEVIPEDTDGDSISVKRNERLSKYFNAMDNIVVKVSQGKGEI